MISFDPYSPLVSLGDTNTAADGKNIADNFETFLTLLTTQLQNQNPLDPLDTNQFTSQLVEFTSVEQAVKTNKNLEDLAKLSAANAITGAVTFVGKKVAASGLDAQLKDGEASWIYFMADQSPEATFIVKDSSGNEVFSQTINQPAQEGVFTWNGRNSDGSIAPAGTYTISVVANNGIGGTVDVTTNFTGTVTEVDMQGTTPILKVGGREVKLEDIIKILGEEQAPATS